MDNQYVVQVGSVENAGPGPTLSDATLTVSKTTSNLALASTATGVEGTSASVTTTGTWLGGATSGTVNVPLDLDEPGEIAQASNPVIVGSNTSLEGFFKLTATVPNLDASQASEVDTHQINVVHRSFVICSDFDWATSILAGTLTPASTYGDGNTYFAADGTTSSVTQGTGTNAAGHVWIAAAQGRLMLLQACLHQSLVAPAIRALMARKHHSQTLSIALHLQQVVRQPTLQHTVVV